MDTDYIPELVERMDRALIEREKVRISKTHELSIAYSCIEGAIRALKRVDDPMAAFLEPMATLLSPSLGAYQRQRDAADTELHKATEALMVAGIRVSEQLEGAKEEAEEREDFSLFDSITRVQAHLDSEEERETLTRNGHYD